MTLDLHDPAIETDAPSSDQFRLGKHTLQSRLIVGTGKYANYDLMARSLVASGTDCITVAVRRERLIDSPRALLALV